MLGTKGEKSQRLWVSLLLVSFHSELQIGLYVSWQLVMVGDDWLSWDSSHVNYSCSIILFVFFNSIFVSVFLFICVVFPLTFPSSPLIISLLPPPHSILVKCLDYRVINSSLDSNSSSLVCEVVNILLHSTRRCKKHSQLTHIITMIHPGKVSVSERNFK